MKRRNIWLAGVLAILAVAGIARAQSTFATITGTVLDTSGAPIPGADIQATEAGTGYRYSTKSNTSGIYTLSNLREGKYRLHAHHSGLRDFVVDGIELRTRDIRRIDITMDVATVETTVEVTAGAGVIETDSGRIASLLTDRDLNSLPFNALGRSIQRYWAVSPMFNKKPGSTVPSFAGSTDDQWVFSIDGTNVSNGSGGNISGNILAYSDWVREVKADYVNNSAEHGQLVHVTIVGKSGENELHGSVFTFYQSPVFRARNPFATARGTGVTHNPGFSVGGPLYIPKVYDGRNRTFWFVSLENFRGSQTSVNLNPGVPLEAWRNGDFSRLGIQIRHPFTNEIYADGRIPAQWINPVARKIQDRFYPLPNFGDPAVFSSANYRETRAQPFPKQYNTSTRLDQRIGERDYFYISFMWDQLINPAWEGNLPTIGPRRQLRQNKVVNITETHTFGPSLLNEIRFGHGAETNAYGGPLDGKEVVQSLGLQGLSPDLPDMAGLYKASFSGVAIQGLTQIDAARDAPRSQFIQDQVSYFRGRHSLRMGVQFQRVFPSSLTVEGCAFGCATFANTFTRIQGVSNSGHPYADFLLGVPTTVTRAFAREAVKRRRWAQDYYLQDDWKVTNRLTLNFGARYEYHPAWREEGGLLALFDPASGKIAVPDASISKVSPLIPTAYVEVVKASSLNLPQTLIHTDGNNIAPRFGVAYRPFGNNTVFRGGYGIYYDATPALPTIGGVPFRISEPAYTNPQPNPTIVLPQAFPSAGVAGASTIGLPAAVNPRLRTPYTQQWNLTLEHERWDIGFRLSYVGTTTRQMEYSRNINAPVPDDRLYTQKPRPFPQYPAINYTDNGASHTYHGLSLVALRRMKHSLQFESSWTWARDIGDVASLENTFDRRRERAVEQGVPTHRFINTFIYELPFGRGRTWLARSHAALDAVLGGWNLAGVLYLQTGQFLTPTISIPDPTGTVHTTSSTRPLRAMRPDQLRDAAIANPTIAQWFDPTAFAAPPIGRFGNSARGVIIGPGGNVWHATLEKYFLFSENPRVPRLRLSLFASNVFNHPNWGNPNTNLSAGGGTARITTVGGPNAGSLGDYAEQRTMRMSLRIEF